MEFLGVTVGGTYSNHYVVKYGIDIMWSFIRDRILKAIFKPRHKRAYASRNPLIFKLQFVKLKANVAPLLAGTRDLGASKPALRGHRLLLEGHHRMVYPTG
jgi:hypothetical protein